MSAAHSGLPGLARGVALPILWGPGTEHVLGDRTNGGKTTWGPMARGRARGFQALLLGTFALVAPLLASATPVDTAEGLRGE